MSKSVLVVDDDEILRNLYEVALLTRGYDVRTASNGAEGVHLARRYLPDLILLDLDMPVMDGWQVLRYLREYRETRRVPVWVISASPTRDERESWFGEFTVERVLEKPVSLDDLVAEVEARIGPPTASLP